MFKQFKVIKNNLRKLFLSILIIITIFLLDQHTKNFFNSKLQFQVPTEVYSNFDLYLTYNFGVAFSFLSDNENWQKTLLLLLIPALILFLCLYLMANIDSYKNSIALSFILGGAIGNYFDRIIHGYVIDFISLHAFNFYWPTFNVADSFITIGAVIFLLNNLKKKENGL